MGKIHHGRQSNTGYGHFAPVTTFGRLFCIFFAIIGIPLTLSVIADIGQIIATLMTTIWDKYKPYLERLKPTRKKKSVAKYRCHLCIYHFTETFITVLRVRKMTKTKMMTRRRRRRRSQWTLGSLIT